MLQCMLIQSQKGCVYFGGHLLVWICDKFKCKKMDLYGYFVQVGSVQSKHGLYFGKDPCHILDTKKI